VARTKGFFSGMMQSIPYARHCFSVTERDPISLEMVELTVFCDDKTGRYFAIDASFMIDEDPQIVPTPFGHRVELTDDIE